MSQIKVTNDFREQIQQAQQQDPEFQRTLASVRSGKLVGFIQDKEGIWRYQERIYVPVRDDLRNRILEEVDKSKFTVYPEISKMYQDLKKMF